MNRGRSIQAARSRSGFSTVGALVTLVLSGLVLGQLLSMVITSQRGFISSNATGSAASSARHAHLALARLLRVAGSDPHGISIQGIDPDPLNHGVFDNVRLRADYNPPDGDILDPGEDVTLWLSADTVRVRWGADAPAQPYLFGVDSLAFEYFDRKGGSIGEAEKIRSQATSVRLTVRGVAYGYGERREQLLIGRVKLRNGG